MSIQQSIIVTYLIDQERQEFKEQGPATSLEELSTDICPERTKIEQINTKDETSNQNIELSSGESLHQRDKPDTPTLVSMYQRREIDSTLSNDIMIIDATEDKLSQNKKLPQNVDDIIKYIIRQNNES